MASRGAWYPLVNEGVQWDDQGRPFYHTSDGHRDYIPPVVAAQYRDDPRMLHWAQSQGATLADSPHGITTGTSVPGGGFLHGRGQWDSQQGRYEQPINWGNLASAGIGAAIGAPFVAPLFGAGGAAAGGGLTEGLMSAVPAGIASQGVSATVPLALGSLAPAASAGGAGLVGASAIPGMEAAVPAGIASQGASGSVPLGAVGLSPAGAAAAGGATAEAGNSLLQRLMDPKALATLGLTVAGLARAGGGPTADMDALGRQLSDQIAMTQARQRRIDPLGQAAAQTAWSRLPVSSRQGLSMPNTPLPGGSNG